MEQDIKSFADDGKYHAFKLRNEEGYTHVKRMFSSNQSHIFFCCHRNGQNAIVKTLKINPNEAVHKEEHEETWHLDITNNLSKDGMIEGILLAKYNMTSKDSFTKRNLCLADRMIKPDVSKLISLHGAQSRSRLMDAVQKDLFFYNVYSMCDGGSLCNYVTSMIESGNESFDADAVVSLAMDITNGIQTLHDLKIVHGDVHITNILVHGTRALISDFGSCQYGTFYKPTTRKECLSPQSIMMLPAHYSTDVWHMGHVFYYMMTAGAVDVRSDIAMFTNQLDLNSPDDAMMIKEHCSRYTEKGLERFKNNSVIMGSRAVEELLSMVKLDAECHEFSSCNLVYFNQDRMKNTSYPLSIQSDIVRAYCIMATLKQSDLHTDITTKQVQSTMMASMLHPHLMATLNHYITEGQRIDDRTTEKIKRFVSLIKSCFYFVDFIRPTSNEIHDMLKDL